MHFNSGLFRLAEFTIKGPVLGSRGQGIGPLFLEEFTNIVFHRINNSRQFDFRVF